MLVMHAVSKGRQSSCYQLWCRLTYSPNQTGVSLWFDCYSSTCSMYFTAPNDSISLTMWVLHNVVYMQGIAHMSYRCASAARELSWGQACGKGKQGRSVSGVIVYLRCEDHSQHSCCVMMHNQAAEHAKAVCFQVLQRQSVHIAHALCKCSHTLHLHRLLWVQAHQTQLPHPLLQMSSKPYTCSSNSTQTTMQMSWPTHVSYSCVRELLWACSCGSRCQRD